ncbi:hypothetical protein SAMD00019534_013160, partial [Acytostelium subglobosum LB1]|uniref:hypothetical protein n=1 Tax=Acytostelium subglobosum LB1 TaxID=1410327 RepID=UPI00064510A6
QLIKIMSCDVSDEHFRLEKTDTKIEIQVMSGNVRSAFRSVYTFGGKINWFPGHMIKAAKQLRESINKVDVVLEIRDARAPISSGNPLLYDILKQWKDQDGLKSHFIVFNKADLSNHNLQSRIKSHFEQSSTSSSSLPLSPSELNHQVRVAFTQSSSKQNSAATQHSSHPRHPYQVIKQSVQYHNDMLSKLQQSNATPASAAPVSTSWIDPSKLKREINMLVIGVPNVGKSSLINAIRTACKLTKAAKTGALPGVTRQFSGFRVSDDPPAFLVDTPGIMIPGVQEDNERALKLALIGAISEKGVSNQDVADYLLFKLNQLNNTTYVKLLDIPDGQPTDRISELLEHVCRHQKFYQTSKTGDATPTQSSRHSSRQSSPRQQQQHVEQQQPLQHYDFEQASRYFINMYRNGKFGNFCLDKISDGSVAAAATTTTPLTGDSNSEQKQEITP